MNRKVAIVVAFLAMTFASVGLAASHSSANIITGTTTIGGYRIGTSYANARRVFGPQYSSTESSNTCTAHWSNGVTISWLRSSTSLKWVKACLKFRGARVGKPLIAGESVWRTNKGLRVGDSTARLKALYPSAASKGSGAYTVFTLQKGSKVSLQAWVKTKTGKVANFRFSTH
jgi:hypothetical protein